jgi:hypothetical protein
MDFSPTSRPLDRFRNLEGKLPPGEYKSFPANGYVPKNETIPEKNPPLEDKPLVQFFIFSTEVENPEEKFIFAVPMAITSKEGLMLAYSKIMPSYFGKNWDALDEVLHDFSWIKKSNISIVHFDMPNLEEKDLGIYLNILSRAVQLLRAGPRKDFILPDGSHRLEVIFPQSLAASISTTLTLNNF